jgi:4-amino-4-deoxy-L-arabinose transferase-like glycosyltransferase
MSTVAIRPRVQKVRALPAWSGRAARRVPTAAWVCALVACLNAACWSIVTPPFQVPDEPAHVAYVKQLAETGSLPQSGGPIATELTAIGEDLRSSKVAESQENLPISSRAQQERLQSDLTNPEYTDEAGSEYAEVAASQPPLYYALAAIPYKLAPGGTLLDRLALMRLLSALMGGLTALFAYLFVREALPRDPWAWTVAGLGVALVPLLGFMSGSVNPDAMLFAVSAASFYCLARAFRRGLSLRAALALGAVAAVGFLTKLNFVGLAPGLLLGLTILSIRAARTDGVAAYRNLALALAIALLPVAVYVAIHVGSGEPTFGILSSGIGDSHRSVLDEASYVWQLYLPRLPGMHLDFYGISPPRQIWFNGYVGLYGWLDTTFPDWVYEMALVLAGVLVALCLRSLIASRRRLRARATELLVYLVMAAGLMILVGADSFLQDPTLDAEYGQTRYLLPLIPLLGAGIALAARGGGRRWGPVLGMGIVLLFLAHDIFSQLQTVARFYG